MQIKQYTTTTTTTLLLNGSSIWASCMKEYLQTLLRFQNRAARIILDAERTDSPINLFIAKRG